MHPTLISEAACLGLYPKNLIIGDTQSMTFGEDDNGPFDIPKAKRQEEKHDRPSGKKKKRYLKKSEITELLRLKPGTSFNSQTYQTLDKLKILASSHGILSKVCEYEILQGWIGKPKGLLQVLWEHGWIDPSKKLQNYVVDKKQKWLDPAGNILPKFELDARKFVLINLLANCPDFKYEKSAMQKLAKDLSSLHNRKIELLITPKYHCELAGEGIKYGWGLFKK